MMNATIEPQNSFSPPSVKVEPQNSHSSNSFAPTALKVDMQGKTIIYIESFFPNPREAHNILFGETGK